MIKHLLRIIARNKLYYGINLIGLVLGITSSIFIYLYLQSEMTYDTHFSDADRIYRVALNRVYPGNQVSWASIPAPMSQAILENFPEVESTTRLLAADFSVKVDHQNYYENNGLFADENFYEIFDFKVIQGDLTSALSGPRQVILTESLSQKYFNTVLSVGKSLILEDTAQYQVSAVIEDLPINTHFRADLILPMQDSFEPQARTAWGNYFAFYTYIKLSDPSTLPVYEPKMRTVLLRLLGETFAGEDFQKWIDDGNSYDYFLQPLTSIHLNSDLRLEFMPNSSESNVRLFLAIGLFLLVISCVNYINLSTARAGRRMRELGLKKIMGASRLQLIRQLIGESLLLTVVSGLMALLLAYQLLPEFNQLADKNWNWATLLNPTFILLYVVFVLVLGLSAGIYPALRLSNVQPAKIISSSAKGGSESSQEKWIRNALVVLQFGVSFIVIASTLIVTRQNDYLNSLNLGYDKENVLVLENVDDLGSLAETFKNELLNSADISLGAEISEVPGFVTMGTTYERAGLDNPVNVSLFFTDQFGPDVLKLNFVAGRNFRAGDFTDTLSSAILNVEAASQLGWTPAQALQQTLLSSTGGRNQKIIGVVQDYHVQSLKFAIRPVVIAEAGRNMNNLLFKVNALNTPQTLQYVRDKWTLFLPDKPLQYSFLDDKLETLYVSETNTQKLFSIFTLMALFLAGFGMYGLSAYLTELKRKEVAIRKVLGASEWSILRYFTGSQLSIVGLATAIGLPISIYLGNLWLEDFAYHIEIDFTLMLLAVAILGLVGILSIGWYSVKTALENPIHRLRE